MKVINKIAFTILFSMPLLASAGEAKITWDDFNNYTDVRPGNNGARGVFHKHVAKAFEKHFDKLAKQLPEGYKLGVKVDALDLAGDTRMSGVNDYRIIKPIYFPKIDFSYVVTDKAGRLITKGDAKLKDMGFMDKIKIGRDDEFSYDKRLITDWFRKDLLKKIT